MAIWSSAAKVHSVSVEDSPSQSDTASQFEGFMDLINEKQMLNSGGLLQQLREIYQLIAI